tara:strand:+ start:1524 stop:2675 length:1152 start_codon:yes stop_codon:yes gene_type:complete
MDILTQAQEVFEEITKEPIDITEYLKDINETKIISVEDNLKEYLKNNNKKHNTLSEIQNVNSWKKPSGIKPNSTHTFESILKMIDDNPAKPFTISDVWVKTDIIYIITKFNRLPSIPDCIKNLNFASGLNWEALDSPHYYIVEYQGKLVLCSTIGGHRATLCVLSNGYGSIMPCRITYMGSVDIVDVSERCALIHHIDCNKRANQVAEDRLASGVEAKDFEFTKVMQDLIYCRLYVSEDKMKSFKIKDFRKCSSWQGFKSAKNDYGIDITKYAIDMIIKNTDKSQTIFTQAVETIACFKDSFQERLLNLCRSKDIFDLFLTDYFQTNDQSDLKSNGKLVEDVLALVGGFNKWCKKNQYTYQQQAITNKHLVNAKKIGDVINFK